MPPKLEGSRISAVDLLAYPQPSTSLAHCCLTSLIEWELVAQHGYGRRAQKEVYYGPRYFQHKCLFLWGKYSKWSLCLTTILMYSLLPRFLIRLLFSLV